MALFNWIGSSGGTASAFDFNVASNWLELIKPTTNPSTWYWKQASRVPGSSSGTSGGAEQDQVTFGLGPIDKPALSPCLWGGFVGTDATGGYANGIGGGAPSGGTSSNNWLSLVQISKIYGSGVMPTSVPEIAGPGQVTGDGFRRQNNYPFQVIGGGRNAFYTLGWSPAGASGETGIDMQGLSSGLGITFGDIPSDSRYDSLRIKASRILDVTPADTGTGVRGLTVNSVFNPNFEINLNLVRCIRNISGVSTPFGVYEKGYKNSFQTFNGASGSIWVEWGGWRQGVPGPTGGLQLGGPTSKTKVTLSGFLNEFKDLSRPSDSWILSGNRRFGDPEVILKGCTLGYYSGTNLCPVTIDSKSTVGSIKLNGLAFYRDSSYFIPWRASQGHTETWDVTYPSVPGGMGWAGGGGPIRPFELSNPSTHPMLQLRGEVSSSKAVSSLGWSLTGGITGAGVGEVQVLMNTAVQFANNGQQWPIGSPILQLGNSSLLDDGTTGACNVGRITTTSIPYFYVDRGVFDEPVRLNVNLAGSLNVSECNVFNSYIQAVVANNSTDKVSFGVLNLNDRSELALNALSHFNNWAFGVTAGATGATSVVGGIYGDDTSIIRLSSDVNLFNQQVTRAGPVKINKFNQSVENVLVSTKEILPEALEGGRAQL